MESFNQLIIKIFKETVPVVVRPFNTAAEIKLMAESDELPEAETIIAIHIIIFQFINLRKQAENLNKKKTQFMFYLCLFIAPNTQF
jgi:hypothetical protein